MVLFNDSKTLKSIEQLKSAHQNTSQRPKSEDFPNDFESYLRACRTHEVNHGHSCVKWLKVIAAHLYEVHQTTLIEVQYEGGGDSGSVCHVYAWTEEFAGQAFSHFDNATKIPADYEREIDQSAWDVVCIEHSGFWNNDGGRGEIAIQLKDARCNGNLPDSWEIELDHTDYEMVSHDSGATY